MNKYTKILSRFLIMFATVSFGSMVRALLITPSDDWKVYLCIILGCLTLERFVNGGVGHTT